MTLFLFSFMSLNAQDGMGSSLVYEADGNCFSMKVTKKKTKKGILPNCYEIEIELGPNMGLGDEVFISDDYGNSATCSNSCTVTWCYPSSPLHTTVNISCSTGYHKNESKNPPCLQSEGCIVVIGPGGG